ncbi:MAG TPA: hypothetical protein VK164_12510 [Flavobacterium sp.]|uniref:hypothetical protein n=1 Tax=Flavobacterium sp. TaxID=239 RepID=UPI002B4B3DE8|nr:hypothetical protein [Flavobacterium sp.]HLO74754.1 hypothetical protein [Flavobacterium sp.]
MKINLSFALLLFSLLVMSQTKRDIFLQDSIIKPINYKQVTNKKIYHKTYDLLKKVDSEFGYEKDIHLKILEFSYFHNDLDNFKKDLLVLVKDYGFKIDYLTTNENYYSDLINGKLSNWFKKMYLKNHLIWVENNFDKLNDIRALNEINIKDQTLAKLSNVMIDMNLNQSDSVKIYTVIQRLNDENLQLIYKISEKNNCFVLSKNFPIVQNNLNSAIIHNFQMNLDDSWNLLYPHIKTAYKKNEIDNVIFQNYDFYRYLKDGYQEFNSYKIEQIPPDFRKNQDPIPLKDVDFFNEFKKEMKWE